MSRIALVAVLLLPTSLPAQCYSSRSYPVSYASYAPAVVVKEKVVVQEVITPVAVPLAFAVGVPVPAVSYLYNGAGYAQGIAQAAYQQPYPQQYQQQQQPYQQQQYQPQAQQSKLSDDDIGRIVEIVEKRLKVNAVKEYKEQSTGGPPRVPDKQGSVKTDYSVEKVTQILHTRCASCHTGPNAKDGVVIFNADGKLNPKAPRFRIWDATDEGRMPLEAQKDPKKALSDEDVAALRVWARGDPAPTTPPPPPPPP